jgi:hypothetical protein
MFANLGRYWDWLDLQWSEWVINYDFIHQFALAQNLHRVSRDWTGRMSTALADFRRAATDRMELWQSHLIHAPRLLEEGFAVLALMSTIVVLLRPEVRHRMSVLWHLRVASSKSLTPHLATLQYNEMLRILARRGIRKAPAQTPLEFASSVPDSSLALAVHEMTEMYHSARFGGQTPDATRANSLLNLIQTRIQTFAHSR